LTLKSAISQNNNWHQQQYRKQFFHPENDRYRFQYQQQRQRERRSSPEPEFIAIPINEKARSFNENAQFLHKDDSRFEQEENVEKESEEALCTCRCHYPETEDATKLVPITTEIANFTTAQVKTEVPSSECLPCDKVFNFLQLDSRFSHFCKFSATIILIFEQK
ncbi:hypothetical protein MHBO_002933, partial [Bonamia ostreae]